MKRNTIDSPCPICGGHDRLPSGKGIRCVGFLSSDGEYARCTREQFSGGLPLDDKTTPSTFAHRLVGQCNCGTTHGNQPPPARPISKQSQDEIDWDSPTHIFDCRRADGSLVVQKARWDRDRHGQKLGAKLLLWRPPGRSRWGNAGGIQADEFFQLDLLLKQKSRNGKVTAYITESEMNALVLAERENVVAISTFHGSNFIPRGFAPETKARMLEPLRGVHVVVIVDRDDPGQKWMEHVRELVAPLAAGLTFKQSKTTGKGDDAADHLDAGYKPSDFIVIEESDSEVSDNKTDDKVAFNYIVKNHTLIHKRTTNAGLVDHPLCNFEAQIVREEVRDDGVEQQVNFVVTGILATGSHLPETTIPADRFASLSWIPGAWGTRAIVNAGGATKDHLRCAIQLLSKDVARSVVFTHSGWREIDGKQTYLHGGGGINSSGHVEGMSVSLPGSLDRFELPPPPEGEEERQAVLASLRLLDVAPDRITAPLLGMVFRSILGPADFGGHLSGLTGVFKTELATLAQAHFGAFDARHLPAAWSSTANALEGLAFVAKDALLVIDDFAPHGTSSDVARQHRDADRVFRAQGNRSGRARMWADGTLRQVRPPRGMILSTGEDIPAGQSLRARILVLELGPQDVDLEYLTRSQKDVVDGLLAGSLSAFIRWLASRLDDAQQQLRDSVAAWREQSLAHRRAPDMLGQLSGAWNLFLAHATDVGALTQEESEALSTRVAAALLEVGRAQEEHQKASDPIDYFLRLLTSAFVSGEAHLADADTLCEPEMPESWGWRAGKDRRGQSEEDTFFPLGKRIGWLRGEDVYLETESSFGVAQRLAVQQGVSLGLAQRTLLKRMDERGLLKSKEFGRFTTRLRVGGAQQRVVHLAAETLGSTSGLTGLTGLNAPETTGEDARGEFEPTSESTPSTDRAQERAQTGAEASEMGVPAPVSPLSPLSPLVGEDTYVEPEGLL